MEQDKLTISDTQHFKIYGWMSTHLKLQKVDLLVFALIYSYTIISSGKGFYGTQKYLAEWFGVTVQTINTSLKRLVNNELIIKSMYRTSGFEKHYMYKANISLLETLGCFPYTDSKKNKNK